MKSPTFYLWHWADATAGALVDPRRSSAVFGLVVAAAALVGVAAHVADLSAGLMVLLDLVAIATVGVLVVVPDYRRERKLQNLRQHFVLRHDADLALGRTMFQLLVPDVHDQGLDKRFLLELDPKQAAIPWELLDGDRGLTPQECRKLSIDLHETIVFEASDPVEAYGHFHATFAHDPNVRTRRLAAFAGFARARLLKRRGQHPEALQQYIVVCTFYERDSAEMIRRIAASAAISAARLVSVGKERGGPI